MPVRRTAGQSVYAGTVLEEGELKVLVKAVSGSTRFEKIVTMIEDSEKLKSSAESRAEHLADRLVPYTLLGTGLAWLLTRNVTKALSVLMVDFFLCAETCHADLCTVCDPGGRGEKHYCKGRKIHGGGGCGRYDRI